MTKKKIGRKKNKVIRNSLKGLTFYKQVMLNLSTMDLTGSEYKILLFLFATRCNGYATASAPEMSERLHMTEATAIMSVNHLVELGLLSKELRLNKPTRYKLEFMDKERLGYE